MGAGKPRAVKAVARLDDVIASVAARALIGLAAKYVALIRDPDNSRRRATVTVRRRRDVSRPMEPIAVLTVVILIDVGSSGTVKANVTGVEPGKIGEAVMPPVVAPAPPAAVEVPPPPAFILL